MISILQIYLVSVVFAYGVLFLNFYFALDNARTFDNSWYRNKLARARRNLPFGFVWPLIVVSSVRRSLAESVEYTNPERFHSRYDSF